MSERLSSEPEVQNRAARRAAAKRARRIAALGSSAVLAGSAGSVATTLLSASPAGALTGYIVNQLGDAGDGTCDASCTLRDAVDDADNDGDDSQITFGVTGTITLTQGQLPLGGGTDSGLDLTITGPGASLLTVRNDGVTVDRIFYLGADFTGSTVTISGLTLTNGNALLGGAIAANHVTDLVINSSVITANTATGDGGGIYFYNGGDLSLTGTTVSSNDAGDDAGGIWFYDSEDMSLTSSTVRDNEAHGTTGGSGGDGGGIRFYESGDLTITGSTISGNHALASSADGGGLLMYDSGDLTVTNSTIAGNTATQDGGGLFLYQGENMTVTNSTIVFNRANWGAGIKFYNGSSFNVTNTTISGNAGDEEGGGIQLYWGDDTPRSATPSATIVNSTIAANVMGDRGGGIDVNQNTTAVDSTVTILSTTVSGNHSDTNGGGLYFAGNHLTVANSTFANNTAGDDGGGLAIYYANDVSLLQSTITGNSAGADAEDLGDGLYLRGEDPDDDLVADAPLKAAEVREGNKKDKPDKLAHSASDNLRASAVDAVPELIGTIISANGAVDIESNNTFTIESTASLWATKGASVTITDLGGTINTTSPGLGPLADNGGPTQTMGLMVGSPAIDAGPATVPTFPGSSFDQRGPGFARVLNGRVDIGAFEGVLPLIARFTG